MLTSNQITDFHERGFLNAGRVLTDDQIEDLKDALDRVLEGRAQNQPELLRNLAGGEIYESENEPAEGNGKRRVFTSAVVIQIVNIWEADEAFNAHIYNPEITSMISQLMNSDLIRVWHDQIQYKPPRVGTITGWHQDYPAWPILGPADLISAWIPLDDATVKNGCMRMVPGSHKWGIHHFKTGENFEPVPEPNDLPAEAKIEIEPAEVLAGHCHFHHCLTWHGSPKNPSDQPRRAIAVHYMPGHTRFEPRGRHPMDVRVEVQPGEILSGRFFPEVYNNGPLTPRPLSQVIG